MATSCATTAGATGFGKDGPVGGAGGASTPAAPTPATGTRAAPAAGPHRTVSIFAVNVGASTRDAEPDIARANAVWSACGVRVNSAGGECIEGGALDILEPRGQLNEFSDPASPTVEELTLLIHRKPKSAIYAFYVPSMSAGSRGEAFTPSTNHTSALIISDAAAASDTMAHELGHILLDQDSHDPDPDNVLAAGAIRHVGVDHVSAAQCARL